MPQHTTKRRRRPCQSFVEHPRYGSLPHVSRIRVPESETRSGFWSLRRDDLFPESVLLADTEKQNYSVFPRRYYVDVRRVCRQCDRPFIFFAKEQRYWFETLRFFVDADCVQCPDCRRESRSVQRRMRRYSDAMARQRLNDDELDTLLRDATFLLGKGVLKNLNTLGALKNRAMKQLPHSASVLALSQALAAARAEQVGEK